MAFRVAIDESGYHEGAPCIAAGAVYAFKRQHWREYERDWFPRAVWYRDVGFHSTKARADDLDVLAAAVGRWLHAFAITISYDDYQSVVPHRIRSRYGGEYSTAIRALVHLLGIVAKDRKENAIFVLEAGHREQQIVHKMLTDAKGHTFVADHMWVGKDNIATHAADLIAHVAAPHRSGIRSPMCVL